MLCELTDLVAVLNAEARGLRAENDRLREALDAR